MSNIWFVSDTHFFHENVLTFRGDDGNLIRPGFDSIGHMNDVLRENWNSRIKPGDKVYHLGDVTMRYGSDFRAFWATLNGSKRLVIGNHDDIPTLVGYRCFKKYQLWRVFREYGFVCTHIPLPRDQMRHAEFNVHGHIHQNKEPSPYHICVCVEHTKWAPVHLDDLCFIMEQRMKTLKG